MPPASLLLLTGPSAVGKSAVALGLAERLGGEIISVDSMQVYRGLDLGTAKPSTTERARVPHHLIDVLDSTESFDAAQFVRLAQTAVRQIQTRGRRPILTGGTGLYFKAYLEGLGEAPPADPLLRARLEATDLAELLAELRERDPAGYASIDRNNPRRVIRALEVIRLTGRPFSEQRAAWSRPAPVAQSPPEPTGPALQFFGLRRSSADLRLRIEHRVDAMFAAGLVAETGRLLAAGLERNRTAMQAIGYRQVVEHLRGQRPLAETIALVKTRTCQFARRQMTWFRRQLPVRWLEVAPAEPPAATAERIQAFLQPGS
ncbi:MAG: tRNA (adenosine(37)-N6)-dimethylallyltransferase MiaA [Verrucomicrobia bacterium]|nr:tRNA (adenosine(37)-N6)-dimethylallyltransferase MiaA [Verrucomicrobiota bacterium]